MGFGIGLLIGALLFGGCCSNKKEEKPERVEHKTYSNYGCEMK